MTKQAKYLQIIELTIHDILKQHGLSSDYYREEEHKEKLSTGYDEIYRSGVIPTKESYLNVVMRVTTELYKDCISAVCLRE